MPYGDPPFVKPWLREYWPQLNKGQKLYSIQQWQVYLVRHNKNPEEINEHVCDELNIPRNWVSTKARRLLGLQDDNLGSDDEDFLGFNDPEFEDDEDLLGFETPPLRSGTRRYFDDRSRSSNTSSSSSDSDSSSTVSVLDFRDDIPDVVRHEVLDNIDDAHGVDAIDQGIANTNPDEWCFHVCNKKHHVIQYAD
jgi:hypothetical protein